MTSIETALFPESPRVVFKHKTLAQVICQLRFPPILKIAAAEPAEFQDLVRANYSLYEKANSLPEDVVEMLKQLPIASLPTLQTLHRFLSPDRSEEIDLAQDFISVSTTRYERWEKFEPAIKLAKGTLERVYQPSSYSKIGLRYVDIINRQNLGLGEVDWKELLRDSFLGLLADQAMSKHVLSAKSQYILRLGSEGHSLILKHGLTSSSGGPQVYVVDSDFQISGFESTEVFAVLGKLNREAGNLFRWAITKKLSSALEPEPLG